MLDVEYPEYSSIPDPIALSDRLKSTLQVGEYCFSAKDNIYYRKAKMMLDMTIYKQCFTTQIYINWTIYSFPKYQMFIKRNFFINKFLIQHKDSIIYLILSFIII